MNTEAAENLVMAHRYLYYVLSEPCLPDAVYDSMEREARKWCSDDSPVHGVGSSLPSSYSPEQVRLALSLI